MTERQVLGGTDGFRGEVRLDETGPGLVNEETFATMTAALVMRRRLSGDKGPLVVGSDTRPSSERLLRAVIAGARSQGADVINLEVSPTPLIQMVARQLGAAACVAVTASHNPEGDNGWKGMIRHRKPTADENRIISDDYWNMVEDGFSVDLSDSHTERSRVTDYALQYRRTIESSMRRQVDTYQPLRGKFFVVDGAHGAAQSLTADILQTLGARVEKFACDTSGPINDGCGATNLSGLKQFITDNHFHLDPNFVGGIANDGDADRMLAVGARDHNGQRQLVDLSGNHVMWAMAQGQPGIVGTEYTNSGLVHDLLRRGIGFEYCKNGDTYVTASLVAKQQNGLRWTRGGEFTGHYVDTEWLPSGDGVRMAAWFANWVVNNGMTFGDVYEALPLWYEQMRAVRTQSVPKEVLQRDPLIAEAQADMMASLGKTARFILRASGTEPVYRIWAESSDEVSVACAVDELQQIVQERVNRYA